MKKTTYILSILLTGFLGSLVVWYLGCCTCGVANTGELGNTNAKQLVPTFYAFSIKSANKEFDIQSQDNFNFYKHDSQIILPVSSDLTETLKKLKGYLLSDGKNRLEVTGLYNSKEINNTTFPNLGLARANSIKKFLISKKFNSKKVRLSGQLNDKMVDSDSIYHGAASFNLYAFDGSKLSDDKKELEKKYLRLSQSPLVLHFDFGSKELNITDKEKSIIEEMTAYTSKHNKAILRVTGHSDAVGGASINTKVALERANFVKKYLEKIGINASQIKVVSEGFNKPIATNKTPKGRAMNRRVEIVLE